MVAYSQPHGLPYQTAGDKRRDAPKVWLETVRALEERLNRAEDLALRAGSPPIAVVRRTTPLTIPDWLQESIPWEEVVIDTDRMVDLAVDPLSVVPRTSGLYIATGTARIVTPPTIDLSQDVWGVDMSGGHDGAWVDGEYMSSTAGRSRVGNLDTINGQPYIDVTATRMAWWDMAYYPSYPGFRMVPKASSSASYPFTLGSAVMAVTWVTDLYWE